MKIGLVLGGGGAKGSFQAGVIQGLLENGFEITAITGTSVGALNGALVTAGKEKKMIELWENVSEDNTFYPNYRGGKTYGMLIKGSLYSNEWLSRNIDQNLTGLDLLESPIYYGCVSSDLITGKSIFKTNCEGQDIRKYILASASLPPAFPQIRDNQYCLVDGGLTSPIPVSEILEFKNAEMDKIIIIPAGKTEIDYNNPENFLESNLRVIDVMFNSILQKTLEKGLEKYWNNNKLFTVLNPVKNTVSTLECNQSKILQFMEEGYLIGKNFKG